MACGGFWGKGRGGRGRHFTHRLRRAAHREGLAVKRCGWHTRGKGPEVAAVTRLIACAVLRDVRASAMKRWLWRLLGKGRRSSSSPSAPAIAELCRRMAEEVRALVPDRRHFVATEENWPQLRRELKPYRIGLAPVMLAAGSSAPAPRRVPARAPQDSGLQLAPGAPPPATRSRLVPVLARRAAGPHPPPPVVVAVAQARAQLSCRRAIGSSKAARAPRAAAASPCSRPTLPYPLAHGGAVRIYNLLREIASEFDVELFAFTRWRPSRPATVARILRAHRARGKAALSRAALVHPAAARGPRVPLARHAPGPRRRAPRLRLSRCCRWSTRSSPNTPGDILVEHDVTFDLFTQIARRERTLSAAGMPGAGAASRPPRVRRFRQRRRDGPKDAEMVAHRAS